MRHMNRRTAPKVVGGKPQRKNRWARTPNCYNTRQEQPAIDRRRSGAGYRHVLKRRAVERFIGLLPDWNELSVGLNVIQLAPGEPTCDFPLCRSGCSVERKVGADVLGQLGVPDRTFPDKCSSVLLDMLNTEREATVLHAGLVALSHLAHGDPTPAVLRLCNHANSAVRHATVLALTANGDAPTAVDALVRMTRDSVAHVRDWAVFGLGTILDVDTSAVRDALAERLTDPDDDARGEALVGLACRKDQRVVSALLAELTFGDVGTLAVEAAELIAAPELHPHLISLREWWDIDCELLDRAIRVCDTRVLPSTD
jgi:HEAT repeats